MIDKKLKLYDAEYKLMVIVWEKEPISSGALAKECLQRLSWQRPTTYTVLRKLCNRGILQNKQAIVTSCANQKQIQRYESRSILEHKFNGSLPQFIAAYMSDAKLSDKERREILHLIEEDKE